MSGSALEREGGYTFGFGPKKTERTPDTGEVWELRGVPVMVTSEGRLVALESGPHNVAGEMMGTAPGHDHPGDPVALRDLRFLSRAPFMGGRKPRELARLQGMPPREFDHVWACHTRNRRVYCVRCNRIQRTEGGNAPCREVRIETRD